LITLQRDDLDSFFVEQRLLPTGGDGGTFKAFAVSMVQLKVRDHSAHLRRKVSGVRSPCFALLCLALLYFALLVGRKEAPRLTLIRATVGEMERNGEKGASLFFVVVCAMYLFFRDKRFVLARF